MRGVEDLGGGTQAVFQLESGVNISNGAADKAAACSAAGLCRRGERSARFGQLGQINTIP